MIAPPHRHAHDHRDSPPADDTFATGLRRTREAHPGSVTKCAIRIALLRERLAAAQAGNRRAQELRLLKLARRTGSTARLIAELQQQVAAEKKARA